MQVDPQRVAAIRQKRAAVLAALDPVKHQAREKREELNDARSGSGIDTSILLDIKRLTGQIRGFWPTPPLLATRIVGTADIRDGMKILEPEAGAGGIADAITAKIKADNLHCHLQLIEIVPALVEILMRKGYNPIMADFLQYYVGGYDRIIMNPPFEEQMDLEHIMHAWYLLAPGGILVSIMSMSEARTRKRAQFFWDEFLPNRRYNLENLPDNSFFYSGTNVPARVLTLYN